MSRKRREIPLLPSKERRTSDFGVGGGAVLSALSAVPKTTATATVAKPVSMPLTVPQQSFAALATPKAAIVAPLIAPVQSFAQPVAPKSPTVAPLIVVPPPQPVAALAVPKAPIVIPAVEAPPVPAYAEPIQPAVTPPRDSVARPKAVRTPADPGQGGGGSGAPDGYYPSPPDSYYDTSLPPDDGAGRSVAPAPQQSTALVPVANTATAIVPVEKVGLFARIWRFFFGPPKATVSAVTTVSAHGDFGGDPSNTQQAAAVSLVRRARAGDQVAMGTLNLIRENAAKGEPKAVTMYDLLCSYVRQNPVDAASASSVVDKAYVAAVRLSHGEPLSNSRIQEYAETMSPGEEAAFIAGMYQRPSFGSDPQSRRANFMGRTVGLARRLQEIRMPQSQVSNYDHACAWELGE